MGYTKREGSFTLVGRLGSQSQLIENLEWSATEISKQTLAQIGVVKRCADVWANAR